MSSSNIDVAPTLRIILEVKNVVSVNDAYVPSSMMKGGKRHHFLRLSDAAKKFKNKVTKQLKNLDKKKYPWFNSKNLYTFTVLVYFNKSPLNRDLDNICKLLQDAVFSFFKVDDARVIDLHLRKNYKNAPKEYIIAEIAPSDRDIFK